MEKANIVIKETTKGDLDNVMSLCNDGEVMYYDASVYRTPFNESTKDDINNWIINMLLLHCYPRKTF